MTDDDYLPNSNVLSLSAGTGWGLGALLIGCALLVSSCALMVFNVMPFWRGLRGIPKDWAQFGGIIGVAGVAALGILSVVFGIRGWNAAAHRGESTALGVSGTLASIVGLIGWLITGIDLLAILGVAT